MDFPQPIGQATMSSALTEAHHFHQWTYDWIAPYLKGYILDIGGGSGNHLKYLTSHSLLSLDLSAECVQKLNLKYQHLAHWNFMQGDITSAQLVQDLGEGHFDTVLSCNVFEHIKDDTLAITNAHRLLKNTGSLVLVLPAHPSLFGSMDEHAGHFRRYNKADIEKKLLAAGFEVSILKYVNLLGAIGWWVNNKLFKPKSLSTKGINGQIKLFDRFGVPFLKWLEGKKSMPFGQSLICVGVKK